MGKRSTLKISQDASVYEKKLKRIVEKLGVTKVEYDWGRKDAFISFWYKGGYFRFEHSAEKAATMFTNVTRGTQCFIILVLALEDLTRVISRGVYDLSVWVSGMKSLPEPTSLPNWAIMLGFTSMPETAEDIERQFRKLSKIHHPDVKGDPEVFRSIELARKQGLEAVK